MGMEYTKFVNRTMGRPINEFRREVPVNQTVRLPGTECILFVVKSNNLNFSQLRTELFVKAVRLIQ
jgi:hypothetical protein